MIYNYHTMIIFLLLMPKNIN